MIRRLLHSKHLPAVLALLLSWGALELWLQHNALALRDDGVWAGHLNIWSDWPLHLAMAGMFADRSPADWFADHPMFAGGALHYPFAVNLLSGLLMRAGLGLDWAMSLPTLVAGFVTPLLLYALFYAALQRRGAALLAVSLFFLGSGFGGFDYLAELMRSGQWSALAYPAREVSRLDVYDWYSGNVLTGMLLPQRAFVLGAPVALLSLLALIRGLHAAGPARYRYGLIGGALAGLLPVVHVHSSLALAMLGLGMALCHLRDWHVWAGYALVAGGIGAVLSLAFLQSGQTQYLRWAPGFSADGGVAAWLLMWWRLWGLALPLTLAALPLLRSAGPLLRALVLGGALCFVFANLVLVQPNRWDNSKIFLWAYLCWAPLWAAALAHLWNLPQRYVGRLVAAACLLLMTLTGALELTRLANVARGSHMIANASDVQLAQQVRAQTSPTAVFLTDSAHNHPIMAFGARAILLGFTGWMANLGFDHTQREADVRRMYAGGAEAVALMAEYDVDYVVIGPAERHRFAADDAWFGAHYPARFSNGEYRIYAVK